MVTHSVKAVRRKGAMDLSMGSRIPNNNYTGRNNLFVVILFLKIRTEEQKKKKRMGNIDFEYS